MSYFDILAPVYKIPAIWFKESRVGIIYLFILSYNAFSIIGCTHKPIENIGEMEDPVQQNIQYTFPPFITPTDQYYEYSIGETPAINTTSYLLTVSGAIENPRSYTLEELKAMKMIDKTVTIECIHNPENGNLISTAIWKGFSLYDLLYDLGLEDDATGVKYTCADGYYTTHGIEEIRDNGVLGALYMNQEPIPLKYGFPLRFVNPGFYGVKNPGWVTAIEVLDDEIPDYWTTNGWKTTTPIGVDTKIFFPLGETKVSVGDTVKIGGAAFGGKRINKVEYSADGGNNWTQARIIRNTDEDYVWVFWEALFIPREQGLINLEFRTTNSQGDVQPRDDPYFRDGTNSRPKVYLKVLQKQ